MQGFLLYIKNDWHVFKELGAGNEQEWIEEKKKYLKG